ALRQQAIARPAFELSKSVAHVIADAKAVTQKFPVRSRKNKCNGFLAHELVKRPIPSAPKRPEVHVLNAPNIVALIDEQPAIQWLTVKPADEMSTSRRRAKIHGLI